MSKKLIAIFLRRQGVDTTTRAGKELCQMLQALVDFEHAQASASVRAGLKRARAAGKKLGRPRIDSEAAIRKALSKKKSAWRARYRKTIWHFSFDCDEGQAEHGGEMMTTENKKLAAELLAGLTTRTVYGRALWAPALVNGDLSGLDRAEVAEMDAGRG